MRNKFALTAIISYCLLFVWLHLMRLNVIAFVLVVRIAPNICVNICVEADYGMLKV